MLHFVSTSLLDAHSQTVVNTVNTVGVMGKGLAKHFADKYPDMVKEYKQHCLNQSLDIGKLWLWKAPDQWILNFPTKQHWRNPSKLEYVEAGLKKFVEKYEERGITEISFPRLGCGNGGLDWQNVKPMMEEYLSPLPITIYIHDFQYDIGAPEHKSGSAVKSYLKSFDAFLADLTQIMSQQDESFKTIQNHSVFKAQLDSNSDLLIALPGANKEGKVSKEDLYEAWQMLLKGPLTEDRLIGDAKDEAIYVMGLFASLPYIRPLQIRTGTAPTAQEGVELIDHLFQTETLSAD